MKRIAICLLFALLGWASFAQTYKVSGSVLDEHGDPLSGAAVVSGNAYAITDINGLFSLQAPKDATVTVSFLGYDDYSFTVSGANNVTVHLIPSAATVLNESVAIGYGKTTKKEVTGSVTSIKAESLDLGSYTNAGGMLQGKVAGLTVVNPDGGDPEASFQFLLRGTNTLSAGQGPLIIIDGVVDGDIRSINFQEVESVDVLKDGSAAAIYGTRGTNGVVIITTKRAKSGKTSVQYDGQVSVQTVQSRAMPMTAREFEYAIRNYAQGHLTQLYGSDTDWFKEITRTPVSHKHNLAISGGTDSFSHRTVINVEQNQGLQIGNEASKILLKTNVHQKALEGWLDLDYNLGYTIRKASPANYSAFYQAFIHNPTEPVYNPEQTRYGGYNTVPEEGYYNPVAMIKERSANKETGYLTANGRATLNILPVDGLKWDNFVSYTEENHISQSYKTSYYPGDIGMGGIASSSADKYINFQWESTGQYSKVFADHSIQALLGYTWQQQMSWETWMENYNYDSDYYTWNNIGAGKALQKGMAEMSTSRSSSRYIAFFGRAIYNYKERYLASVSLRRDGSSRFGKNHKWGWFPAVSLGWRISKEPWMEQVSWLDELKLRAGYGVTGNQDFGNYKSMMLMSSGTNFYYDGQWVKSYAPASNSNPDLGWERKSEFNVGVDFSVLDGRINGTLDYYYRLTTDLLYDYTVPVPPYDYKTLFTNVGSISNSGIELSLNAIPVKTKNMVWNTSLVAAHNENKLISFTNEQFKDAEYKVGWDGDPINANLQRLIEGESLGSFFAPVWTGVGADGQDHFEDEFVVGGGEVKVPEASWQRIGTAYPDLTLGWSNSVRIRNLTVSMTLRASIGGLIYNAYRTHFENLNEIGLKNIMSSWLDNPSFTGQVRYSSKYLEDGSYLKLDNVSVSYDLPIQNKFIHGARVFVSGQNLLCLTGYKGVDPEVSLTGLAPGRESTSYYPRTSTFTLGASLTF